MAPPVPIGLYVPPVTGVKGSSAPVANSFDSSGLFRSRSGSQKRQRTDSEAEIDMAFDIGRDYPKLLLPKEPTLDIQGVQSLLVLAAKEKEKLKKQLDEGELGSECTVMVDSVMALYNLVEAIIEKALVPMTSKPSQWAPRARAGRRDASPIPPPKPDGTKELRAALEKAETEAIVFDMNLGPVPIFNRNKLSANFSASLKGLAEKVEGDDTEKAESVRVLDDAFSAVEDISFLGQSSKKFVNNRDAADPRNNTFCTLPTKLKFTDKESRIHFENTLKKIKGPRMVKSYPQAIRKEMQTLTEMARSFNPHKFISVCPNPVTLTFGIYTKGKDDSKWERQGSPLAIPLGVLSPNFRSDPERDYGDKALMEAVAGPSAGDDPKDKQSDTYSSAENGNC